MGMSASTLRATSAVQRIRSFVSHCRVHAFSCHAVIDLLGI